MQAPLPSFTLADRLAGLPGEAGLEAEEAGRLTRLFLEMLDRLLAVLVGLAARFAAGTLPVALPRSIRPSPAVARHLGLKSALLRQAGGARTRMYRIKDELPLVAAPLETATPNRMAVPTRCAFRPIWPVAQRLPYASTAGPCDKIGNDTKRLVTPISLRYRYEKPSWTRARVNPEPTGTPPVAPLPPQSGRPTRSHGRRRRAGRPRSRRVHPANASSHSQSA